MNKLTLFKAGSIAFMLLGLIHLMAHFGMTMKQEPNQLMMDMESYKIHLFGEHSLLQFHIGFSIMMGFMLAAFGLQNLLCAKFITQHRGALFSSIVISAVSFVLAFTYFHVLAYGFILFTTTCYTITAFMSDRKALRTKSTF